MGNALGGSRKNTAKIMKVNGKTTRVKTPIQAKEVTEKHPAGHVLMESEAVKEYGIRAKPLEATEYLKARRVYFLVELPRQAERSTNNNQVPRRVRSGGIHMSAKDRLESLMLSRRAVSDLSAMKPMSIGQDGAVRVRMRVPREQVERLMRQSKDEAEAAQRIMDLCCNNNNVREAPSKGKGKEVVVHHRQPPPERSPLALADGYSKKRVGFLPATDDEIRLAVSS